MGDMADMMLDGTLCEGCGEFIDHDDADGFPRYCSQQCAKDRGVEFDDEDFDDDDHEPTIEDIHNHIDGAIIWLEMSIEDLKSLKIKGKTKEISWLINRLQQFKQKLG